MTTTANTTPDPDEVPDNVLPLRRTGDPPVGPVVPDEAIEGELLTAEQSAELDRRLAARRMRQAADSVGQVVRVVRASPATGRVARGVRIGARAGWTVAQGHVSWARRATQAATYGHVREQIRLARLAGDPLALAEWTERLDMLKNGRAQRLRELPGTLWAGLRAVFVAVTVLAGVALLAGVAMQFTPGGWDWATWWGLIGDVLGVAGLVVTIAVQVVLWGTGPALLVAAWREGRRAAVVPRWLVSEQERAEMDSEITPDLITRALAHVKVTALTKYLKEGGQLEYLVQPREQGGGTYTQIRLPLGVVAADLLPTGKAELLAGNLGRHKHEVWPQRDPAADARVLDLWIADKGTMDKPAPPWPLLDDGEFDVFRDRLPFGVTMRQEQISVGMLQKHWLIGATSKQGKSTVMRLLALGLALDPTVELLVADLKGDGDWKMFVRRASQYVEGSTDEHAGRACDMLEWAVGEMERRYQAKSDQGIVGPIPRELSRRKGSGFHPVYVFVDECQVLYGAPHPVGGTKDDSRAVRAAKRLHDQARAVNIHLAQATQRPDDRTLPVRVREGAHVRCALNVPNEGTARMILADAVDRGARPQDLRPGADAGTVVATGEVEDIPAGQAFVITRTNYVSTQDAYRVIDRAMAILARHGRTVDPAGDTTEPAAPVDHLADIERAMRDEPYTRTTLVLARLIEDNPEIYEDWNAERLAEELRRWEIPIRKISNKVVHSDDVANAITRRDNGELTGDPADTDEDDR
ncbi:S-DNA-T family DNA segregation ATPase FtsK/SpoIIIE [Saccharothrix tamanrassetensis]|uniref:S-DNA-T family DNA segregation ATPase FtsK/SpoIIIE n=1 Tax=Saccharothrix tamanrassetensis TaxID=1051531 RepID=A0A841CSJ2_9PSEU|nr:FtsK/SpoIIIE domain-containing protein [Saccharothrix tamanrassetensis]MBB5958416.1 S-DNA-T family DNA segregation ATPase FtsK/SpoIIIE [Saccharothrix tamanrassetensis]